MLQFVLIRLTEIKTGVRVRFIGTLFMHNFASFVAVCRSIVHRRVLWFFRDPDDPDFHPLKQMLELPLIKYVGVRCL
jgi:E3 ubiquitin-protein ligase DOA10